MHETGRFLIRRGNEEELGLRSKILIIEDNLLLAESMREMLGLLDYEIVGVAASVRHALLLAETTRPDLAIVDVASRRGPGRN